jgi:hypothetical protein
MVQLTQELLSWFVGHKWSRKFGIKRKTTKKLVLHYEDQLTDEWQSVFNHALGIKSVTTPMGKPFNPTRLEMSLLRLVVWIPQSPCFRSSDFASFHGHALAQCLLLL